jgi:F-box-like
MEERNKWQPEFVRLLHDRLFGDTIFTAQIERSIACRLPVELLQTIFLLLAEFHAPDHISRTSQAPSSSSSLSPASSRPNWITITHVCRHWRSAALGLRELWSVISPGLSISWAQAMMERSAPLPVHVDIRISCSSSTNSSSSSFADGFHPLAASELLFVASRIRTLRLAGLRNNILHVLSRLRSPSSKLESLTLSIYDGGGPPVSLPVSLFGGNEKAAPNLRRLTFATDTCINAPLWLLGGITEFTTGADVTLLELLDTLQAMPQLQVLRVQHCRAVWDEDVAGAEGAPLRVVTLPHLRLIAFRDTTPRRFVLLVPRIDAPPTVRRCLFWRSWAVASWERWSGMLDVMRAFIPRDSVFGAGDGGLRAARVRGGPARGSFTVWSRSASASGEGVREEDALFVFRIDWKGSPVDPRGETLFEHSSPFFHLGGLCTHLPAMRVSDLTIEPEPEPDAGQAVANGTAEIVSTSTIHWESLLRALDSVQSLRMHGGDRLGLGLGKGIEISSSILRTVVSASDSETLLPHLQRLYIVQCDVRCTERDDGVVFWNLPRFALPGTVGLKRQPPEFGSNRSQIPGDRPSHAHVFDSFFFS